MRFKFLTGDIDWQTYGGQFISKKLSAGEEFDYWLVMEVINLEEAGCDEDGFTYGVGLGAVAPELISADVIQDRLDQFDADWVNEYFKKLGDREQHEILVAELHAYGSYGTLSWEEGNNLRELMKEARARADHIAAHPWRYFNDVANQLGSTYLDFMRGNPLAGLSAEVEYTSHGPALQNVLLIMEKT